MEIFLTRLFGLAKFLDVRYWGIREPGQNSVTSQAINYNKIVIQ
jgi:hypothetical protein